MFTMLEIVGISKESFSDAVKNAIDQLDDSKDLVSWFEVVEQRGAIREGQLREYQVKIKVAVAHKEPKTQPGTHICPTCQENTTEGHLCIPTTKKDKKCAWCGALIVNERHLCQDKIKDLSYICNSCGRTAVKSEHLCHPKKIK